jgi:peptidoglycan-N-acetylglucosamine deacetylase
VKRGRHQKEFKLNKEKIIIGLVALSTIVCFYCLFFLDFSEYSTKDNQSQSSKPKLLNNNGNEQDFFSQYDNRSIPASNQTLQTSDFVTLFEDLTATTQPRRLIVQSSVDDIFSIDIQEPYIAITFDDCPLGDMEGILDVLEKYDMRCTFFMLGEYMDYDKGWAEKVISRGHTVGNHSYSHPSFKRISNEKAQDQLDDTADLILKETGIAPTLFRPPYGSYTPEEKDMINEKGYSIAMWNVDTLDWKNARRAYDIASSAQKGDVILFHTGKVILSELDRLLASYQTKGLKSIPMEEMLVYSIVEQESVEALKDMKIGLR